MIHGPAALRLAEIKHDSKDYWETVELRRDVLRKPLGLDFSPEELSKEAHSIHLCARGPSNEILACLILLPRGNSAVQMRQVAVRSDLQGQGIGRAIVLFSENIARAKGFSKMILHAREGALKFYENLNYKKLGDPFEEVGLTHFLMEKSLEA